MTTLPNGQEQQMGRPPQTMARRRAAAATRVTAAQLDLMARRAWLVRWRNPALSKRTAETVFSQTSRTAGAGIDAVRGHAARVVGWHERWQGHFDRARDYFLMAEDLLASTEFQSARIEAMAGRAVGLYSQGKQDQASELVQKALGLLGHGGATSTRVDLFLVQATIVSYSRAFEDALSLTDEAISLARGAGVLAELSHALHIRARVLMRKGDPDGAMAPAQEAVDLAITARNAVVLPYAFEVLGAANLAVGRLADAAAHATQAITLGERRQDQRVVCQALDILGKVQRRRNEPAQALVTLRRGLAIATEISYPLWQRWFQLEIAGILEARQDYRGALCAYKAYSELDQTLFRKETETRMAELHTKFDLARARERAMLERARAEELAIAGQRAELAARTDGLTRIANRAGLDAYVSATSLLSESERFCYVVVDLDRFKPINDTFGHAAGDAVLAEVASRLSKGMRSNDLVARIGGDEFAIVARGCQSAEDARRLGERIMDAFVAPVRFEHRQIDVSASIGIAQSHHTAHGLDGLMSSADRAMYAAKRDRHTSYRIFDPAQDTQTLNLNTLATLRQALRTGEIQPWYQPKVALHSGRVVGFEALARWVKPDGSIVGPDVFLPLIKQHNLQGDFTFSILRAALRQRAAWAALDGPVPDIAINMVEEVLASRASCDEIVTLLGGATSATAPITFEITEDVFFDRAAEAIQASIQTLTRAGVRFSLDDFGTGYGSFLHLNQLQLHELKIDIDFVQGIGKERSAEVIIQGFISIAKGLGLSVAAEGIETEDQLAFLIGLGCEVGQGYLFSPALPGPAATDFMQSAPARRAAQSGGGTTEQQQPKIFQIHRR